MNESRSVPTVDDVRRRFAKWEKIKDLVDQNIDIMLNYRQSGHPGGSRSKVHALIALLLSGAMRWDIRHPEKSFGDRFILSAGHTIPLVYATLAVFNEALRIKHRQTGDGRYALGPAEGLSVVWEDLATLRRRGGLAGHAEMEGKTLLLKWNTGPSGHGLPASVGEAAVLRRAGADGVNVVAIEGEGGLTAGASHEAKNAAWALGLDNLFFLIDWNDFGIDDRPTSSVVHGSPTDWFEPYGWDVSACEDGSDWEQVVDGLLHMFGSPPGGVPRVLWLRTRKGRGYLTYDNKSHGTPHPMNSELFWQTKREFADRYEVEFEGFGKAAPESEEGIRGQCLANLERVADVLARDQGLVDYLADTLVGLGNSVPESLSSLKLDRSRNPANDAVLYDYEHYPKELYLSPGATASNRNALAKFGAWINSYCAKEYGRPLFLVCSADLAGSTNIAGFGEGFGDFEGYGWYEKNDNPDGVILPQEITEFTNAGIAASLSSVNFSLNPFTEFNGFYGACSTYGSFSYLKYGEMRLFSQLAQDSQLKVGKVLWVAAHSGPETAEDARTHFGIFSPTVTQLFPDGSVINLYPWEYNEVPVVLGAALKTSVPIIVLHLARPAVEIPDRSSLGIDSHLSAAKGAYVIRPFREDLPRMGTVIVQGTGTTVNIVKILPQLDARGLNVKIVAAVSPELFRMQNEEWRKRVLPKGEWRESMVISNVARRSMTDWLYSRDSLEYSMTADFDNRWRTGGSVDEVLDEAHLSPEWLFKGIERFAHRWTDKKNEN